MAPTPWRPWNAQRMTTGGGGVSISAPPKPEPPKPPKRAKRESVPDTKWAPRVGDVVWYRSSMQGYVDAHWPAKVIALSGTAASIRTWDVATDAPWSPDADASVHRERAVRLSEIVSPVSSEDAHVAEGDVQEGDCLYALVRGAYWRATAFRRSDGKLWTLWRDFKVSTDPGLQHLWMAQLSDCLDVVVESEFLQKTTTWGRPRESPERVEAAVTSGLRAVAQAELDALEEEAEDEQADEPAHGGTPVEDEQADEPAHGGTPAEDEQADEPAHGGTPASARRRSVAAYAATPHQTVGNKPNGVPVADGWRVVTYGTEFRPATGYVRLSDAKLCRSAPEYEKEREVAA